MKRRCTACNGNKKIMKLGMIMGECGICKGTGLEKTPDEPWSGDSITLNDGEVKPTIDKDVTNDAKREESREVKKTDSKTTPNQVKRKK
jgi:hypothetical protein